MDVHGEMRGILVMTVTYDLTVNFYNTSVTSYINTEGVQLYRTKATTYLTISTLNLNTAAIFFMMYGMGINIVDCSGTARAFSPVYNLNLNGTGRSIRSGLNTFGGGAGHGGYGGSADGNSSAITGEMQ